MSAGPAGVDDYRSRLPDGDEELARELAPYANGKGTLRLSYADPVPVQLIEQVAAALAARAR